ncbi:hypothetical protein BH11MYX3_BH11MYX3_09730 [soil metagenome]
MACNTAGERAETGECPAGEVCSPNTPRGLHFIGNTMADELFGGDGPGATAIGGTQEVAIEMERADGVRVALAIPYQADDDGGLGVTVVSKTGSVVTVKGARSRSNYLRIIDPTTGELYDRYTLTGAALTSMRLVGTSFERTPTDRTDLVFATGEQEVGVALVGEVQETSGNKLERLVDTSMVLDLPGSTRTSWDSIKLANATPGTYPLQVTAGDKPAAAMPITVVAGADAIATLDAQPTIPAGGSSTVCFQATSNSRYIYGLVWTFTANGTTTTKGSSTLARNCISVSSEGMTSGSIPLTASAGGKTLAVNVLIGQMARSATGVATSSGLERSVPTAGDRAAM